MTRDAPGAPDTGDPPDGAPADVSAAPACVSDAGVASPADFAGAPACVPGSCVITWNVDGAQTTQTYPLGAQFAFANGTRFDADFGTGGHVYMNMSGAIAQGAVEATVGTLTPAKEGPLAGDDLCLGDGSRIEYTAPDGGLEVLFLGRCVSGSCPGATPTPMSGTIVGCCAR